MAIRVCPLCQAEFLEFKTVCSHCDVALLDPEADVDPRSLDADSQIVYELGGWPLDAQGDAGQVLAESGIPHVWDGTDVIMPLIHEAAADRLLEQIEKDYGLHSADDGDDDGQDEDGELGDEAGETEYDMKAWPTARRIELVEKLVEISVPHRWEGDLLLVPTNLEDAVDDVLDEMEGGSVAEMSDEPEDDEVDPAEALSGLFLAGERMRKGKVDVDVYGALLAVLDGSDEEKPPYGFDPMIWEQALLLGETLADAVAEDNDAIEQVADELFHLLRPFV